MYQQGGITHSIFVNWTDPYQKTKDDFDQTFKIGIQALKDADDIVKICTSLKDWTDPEDDKTIKVILGIEGLNFLSEPEDIISLYNQGIRHAIITWNEENAYATGVGSMDSGLKEKGRQLLNLMEQLGIIIDLSHANPKTFDDVMASTKGPIIVSHGNAKALCDHRRNYSDDQLLKLKSRGGVIGVCAVPNFISKHPERQNVTYLAKHIDYIVKLIGIDHVGIGMDVFYYLMEGKSSTGVKGLETIQDTKNLLDELESMGYDKKAIDQIAFGNFDRIVRSVLK